MRKKNNNGSPLQFVSNSLLAVCFFAFMACSASAQPSPGMKAKDISLPNVNGETISLSSLQGKVVLIDFWASWCRPCRQAMPGLKKLYSDYHDKGFEIYSISLDDNAKAWKKAIEADETNWIHVNDRQGNTANQWVVQVIPTTFLLDRNGKIVAVDEEAKDLSRIIAGLTK